MPLTYNWGLTTDISSLTAFRSLSGTLPLIAVGSGGSFTAAIFTSLLHQELGMHAQYLTPLEFITADINIQNTSVILFTAKGGNSDVLLAVKNAIRNEARQLLVLCTKKGSAIGKIVNKFRFAHLCEFEPPSKKDGFLATNSLLTFFLVLLRTQEEFFPGDRLPISFNTLIEYSSQELYSCLKTQLNPLVRKRTLIVLHGKWGKPAAFDLESKFTESALCNVRLADYRNFAHGRHYWLAKWPSESGVLALISPEDKRLAEKHLELIPKDVPIIRLTTKLNGSVGALSLLVKAMYLVGVFGEYHDVDPGQPRVPTFGRKLYHLTVPSDLFRNRIPLVKRSNPFLIRAIKRKIPPNFFMDNEIIDFWIKACNKFVKNLETNTYHSVVFDYDGTLCNTKKRYEGISGTIGGHLTRLLDGDISIGIATGRGKSVRNDLQKMIPKRYWSKMLIGYYNGSDIGLLNDLTRPNKSEAIEPKLKLLMDHLSNNGYFNLISKSECRPNQITFTPKRNHSIKELSQYLRNIVENKDDLRTIQILESDHSIDVLAPKVSKLNVLIEIQNRNNQKTNSILCIGDKGKWPGNDFYLLSVQNSLSVDTVSPNPNTCWNLAPAGHRCTQAAEDYLKAIHSRNGEAKFDMNILRGG